MRATQLLLFFNVEIIPGSEEIRHYYTHLSVTDGLKGLRRNYRRDLKRINNECSIDGLFPGTSHIKGGRS